VALGELDHLGAGHRAALGADRHVLNLAWTDARHGAPCACSWVKADYTTRGNSAARR
jgi:hypothetical protein